MERRAAVALRVVLTRSGYGPPQRRPTGACHGSCRMMRHGSSRTSRGITRFVPRLVHADTKNLYTPTVACPSCSRVISRLGRLNSMSLHLPVASLISNRSGRSAARFPMYFESVKSSTIRRSVLLVASDQSTVVPHGARIGLFSVRRHLGDAGCA